MKVVEPWSDDQISDVLLKLKIYRAAVDVDKSAKRLENTSNALTSAEHSSTPAAGGRFAETGRTRVLRSENQQHLIRPCIYLCMTGSARAGEVCSASDEAIRIE